MTIGFAGLSHLGLVSAIAAAAKGFAVVAFDPDHQLTADLAKGRLPVFEPQLPEVLAQCGSRLTFTSAPKLLQTCDVVFLARDVPTDEEGKSDLGALTSLAEQVVAHLSPAASLVILSQVPPGFTRSLRAKLGQDDRGRGPVVFYQVETLIFGRAVERAMQPERVIVGCADAGTALPDAYATYLSSFACPILPMRYESAELAKIAINVTLVASVTVANTLAELCERIGADWAEILPALRLDRRIGPYAYLSPGLGLAGGNLERDLETVRSLARRHGTDVGLVDAALVNSRHRRAWVQSIIHAEVISRLDDPTIAVWGLAYKPDTASIKNSPAVALIRWLRPFTVRAYDPQARLPREEAPQVTQVSTPVEACRGAHALAIMTPWAEFTTIDLEQVRSEMAGRLIVDPFGVLNAARCREAGFAYLRLGAGNTESEIEGAA